MGFLPQDLPGFREQKAESKGIDNSVTAVCKSVTLQQRPAHQPGGAAQEGGGGTRSGCRPASIGTRNRRLFTRSRSNDVDAACN